MASKRMGHTERRASLLAAAAAVFARLGFDGATTSAIAAEASVSEPILYRHFADKQELFCSTVDWATERVLAEWRQITQGVTSVRDQLLAIATINHKLNADQAIYTSMLMAAPSAISHSPAIRATVRRAFSQLEDHLTGVIRSGQQDGQLRPDISPEVSAWTLLSLGLAHRLTTELELGVSGNHAWEFGAGSRYLDTLT